MANEQDQILTEFTNSDYKYGFFTDVKTEI